MSHTETLHAKHYPGVGGTVLTRHGPETQGSFSEDSGKQSRKDINPSWLLILQQVWLLSDIFAVSSPQAFLPHFHGMISDKAIVP